MQKSRSDPTRTFFFWCCVCLTAASSAAQEASQGETSQFSALLERQASWKVDCPTADHCILTGDVELPLPDGRGYFFADRIELFREKNLLVASGNVVFANPEGQISADSAEFDFKRNTGTFHVASGLLGLGADATRRQFGNQEVDVYFQGEEVEKLSDRRYRVTHGGFTTCVQPTPRWELVTGSVVLNLGDYALARNTVLRVKGVPLLYMPLVYYPIQDSDRATGFLLPTYGTSTLRGQSLSNAFFWAIGRSQDATFFHDWFTRTGQGAGVEYRYAAAAGSTGNIRLYGLSQREAAYATGGTTATLPASRSFELTGNVNHVITPSIRARARLDYFSSIASQQLYHQNIYQASRNSRVIESGLTAGFGPTSTAILYQRNELLNGADNSYVYGSTPRVTASVAPQRLFGSPVYASLNSEYGFLPNQSVTDGVVTRDESYSRFDVRPTVRIPLSGLPFLSVNTSATYHATYYSRSVDPAGGATVGDPYLRQYASLRSDVVGPVFTRIWDRPGSVFAERLKHVIEPAFTVDITSRIADYTHTPVVGDVSDFVVSGATKVTYGVTNRLFARGKTEDPARGRTREFLTVGLQQTY